MRDGVIEFINNNRSFLDFVTDMVPVPLFIKDRSGRYIDCNLAFEQLLAIGRDQIIGKTVYDIWAKKEADVFYAQDTKLFAQGGLQVYETEISSASGVGHQVQFHKQVFTDASGEILGFLGAMVDITERKHLEAALAALAATDELTGLPNRRDGMARLEALHKDSERKNRPFCLAMVDLDHFKRLNDRYGHGNGDRVLKGFGNLARETLRGSDVCFRYGGEEFVILLPETEMDTGRTVIERLRQAWSKARVELEGAQPVRVTVSIGLGAYPATRKSVQGLLQACDAALYEAKDGGRNRTVCCPESS